MVDENPDGPKGPLHPGAFVKSRVVARSGLSVTEAAEVLRVSRTALSAFLNQRTSLSPEMAVRLERAFGVSMESLMRMQNKIDIAQARAAATQIEVERFVPRRATAAARPIEGPGH